MRTFYIWLLRLHPAFFRRRFAEEMLWIFDLAESHKAMLLLIGDCAVSLVRQWVLRSEQTHVTAESPRTVDAPLFTSFEEPPPRPSALINGALVSVLVFGIVSWGFHHSRKFPASTWLGGGNSAQFAKQGSKSTAQQPPEDADETDNPLWILANRDSMTSDVAGALVEKFDRYSLVALGELHSTLQDSEVRLSLLRHPAFARKVSTIVMECASATHQGLLDSYVSGEGVPKRMLRSVWRDVSTPGACDSPVYDRLIDEVRQLNSKLPPEFAIRILAGDPPIDWGSAASYEYVTKIVDNKDKFAASLISRDVVRKGQKALIVFGAGHLWRNTLGIVIPRDSTLSALVEGMHPGQLFTVLRVGGPGMAPIDGFVKPGARPVYLPLRGTVFGRLDANRYLCHGMPVQLFPHATAMAAVADALIYSGKDADRAVLPLETDPQWEAEKQRRRKLRQRP